MQNNRNISHIICVTFVLGILIISSRADQKSVETGYSMCCIGKLTIRQAQQKTVMRKQPDHQNLKKESTLVGAWGGEHIRLEITERGGSVEFDCAHGEINQKITVDQQGRFVVSGTYVEEHSGPIRKGEQPSAYPVQYIGRIQDKNMTLSVRHSGTKKTLGRFTLVKGQEAMLVKCR